MDFVKGEGHMHLLGAYDRQQMNRRTVWSDEEVGDLIHVWGGVKIQQELDGASRNKPIFVVIAKKKWTRQGTTGIGNCAEQKSKI